MSFSYMLVSIYKTKAIMGHPFHMFLKHRLVDAFSIALGYQGSQIIGRTRHWMLSDQHGVLLNLVVDTVFVFCIVLLMYLVQTTMEDKECVQNACL